MTHSSQHRDAIAYIETLEPENMTGWMYKEFETVSGLIEGQTTRDYVNNMSPKDLVSYISQNINERPIFADVWDIMSELLPDALNPKNYIATKTETMQDGWKWERVTGAQDMSAAQLLKVFNTKGRGELCLIFDEGETPEFTFQEMVAHILEGLEIGFHPNETKPKPIVYDYFVTITEHRKYRITAESEQDAINKSGDYARDANPISYDYDPVKVELCK